MAENKILIEDVATIVCCSGRNDIYRSTDMLIGGEKALEIGYGIRCNDAKILDEKDKFVYLDPANIHHRFFQTFVRNLAATDYPNMLTVEWLNKVYRIFQKIGLDMTYYSSLTTMADLVEHGYTTVFDHQYCLMVHTKEEAVDRQMEAASRVGTHYHAGRGTNTLPRSQGSTISDDMRETIGEFIQDIRHLAHTYHDPESFSMKQIVITPCQPVDCYEDMFTQSVKLAKETGTGLHTHLGEGENDIMEEHWGMRTLDWRGRTGSLGENIWFAHRWELASEEHKVLGASGCGISHYPSPVILKGFPILEMKKLMDYGVPLGLGYDGSATNNSSNLPDSIHTVYMIQYYHSRKRGGDTSAYEILKQVTTSNAKTLDRGDIGSLGEGKATNLFMIDAGTLELAEAVHDLRNIVGRVGLTGNVCMIMVNGRVVYENGRLMNVDGRGLAKEGERTRDKVLREPCETFHNPS